MLLAHTNISQIQSIHIKRPWPELMAVYEETGLLNQTSIASEVLWFAAYNTDKAFIQQESQQEKFG